MTVSQFHSVRRGRGKPLLLVHGLGGSWQIWNRIIDPLAAEREVIAIDLPGFGRSPALAGPITLAAYSTALADFITGEGLDGTDAVGLSLGARLLLDPVARQQVDRLVALSPSGMWQPGALRLPAALLKAEMRAVRKLQWLMPLMAANRWGRFVLSAQLSASTRTLPVEDVLHQMRGLFHAEAIDGTLDALVHDPLLTPAGWGDDRLTIGWGRQDRMTFPYQADLARELFPRARFHWFENCGHFPHWDQPEQVVRLVLDATEDEGDLPLEA